MIPNKREEERLRDYANEQGITKAKFFVIDGYPAMRVIRAGAGSKYERERNNRRAEARAKEHLTCLGPNSLEDNGKQGDDYNGRSK